MTDAEGIKAWLDRWDEHQNDNCSCEKCRRKRAILTAVEALACAEKHLLSGDGDVVLATCRVSLASIRKTLVSE